MIDTPRSAVPARSALILAACAALVLAFAPAQYFGRSQDDLLYYLGARALTHGRYCLETSPGCPPLAMINPGWPIFLAPLAALTTRPAAFQLLSALTLALAPVAVWAWLRRRCGETAALLAAALTASSPLALGQAGVAMTEAPFLLLLIGMIAAAQAERPLAAGALLAAGVLLRTAGLAALPAAVMPFALSRRRGDALKAAVPALAAYASWSAWSLARTRGVDKISLLAATYLGRPPAAAARLALADAAFYSRAWGACVLPPRLAQSSAALGLGAALWALAFFGAARALRRRRGEPAAWALLGFAALHLLWGWQYERYLLPLLPLMAWAVIEAAGRFAPAALSVLLALQLAAQALPRLIQPSPYAEPELARTYAWLAARPRPALLSSAEFVRDGWYAGLPAVPLVDAPSPAAFAAAMKRRRVSYVLRQDGLAIGLDADPGSPLRAAVERGERALDDPKLFRLVHAEPAEGARVYAPL